MTQSRTILVVEDDRTLNRLLCAQLAEMGHRPIPAHSRAEALERLAAHAPELALLDVRLPDCDGLAFLPELRNWCPVIVLTAFASIDQAVGAVKNGASEYLVKPVTAETLDLAVSRAFETVELKRDLAFWQAQAQRGRRLELVGDSPAMAETRRMVALLAASDAPVLILGEGGTGKSVAAAALHAQGPRANGRLVAVDCDPEMMESELFGKVRDGRLIEGLFAAAENGTILLNDVDKLSGPMQGRLLRVLEQGSYRPHGSTAEIGSNARIVATSSTDLRALSQQGAFRPQLYYQLAGLTLTMPPLRRRLDDLPQLARSLLNNRSFQRDAEKSFTPDALAALAGHDWPGNVRELANAVDHAVMMSAGEAEIRPEHLGLGARAAAAPFSGVTLAFARPPTLDEMRDAYIVQLLDRFQGNRQRIADTLGVSERNLYRLLKTLPQDG